MNPNYKITSDTISRRIGDIIKIKDYIDPDGYSIPDGDYQISSVGESINLYNINTGMIEFVEDLSGSFIQLYATPNQKLEFMYEYAMKIIQTLMNEGWTIPTGSSGLSGSVLDLTPHVEFLQTLKILIETITPQE
jgi:hypothetical protein